MNRGRQIGAMVTVLAMLGCVVPAIAISIHRGTLDGLFGPDLGAAVTFACVGAFLLVRGAVRCISVIVCVQGVGAATTTLLGVLAQWGPSHGMATETQRWAGWLNNMAWLPGVVLLTPLVLLFPTGRLLSARWRWPIGLVTLGAAVFVVFTFIGKVPVVDGRSYAEAPNPLGFVPLSTHLQDILGSLIFGMFVICLLASVGSLIVRRRRANGVERSQLMSLLYGATLTVGMLAGLKFSNDYTPFAFTVELFAVMPIAVGIAVAVLRYRLYEIDRLVSRTVTYGLVLVVLAGVYVGVLAGLAGLVPSDYGQVGVAAATLLVSVVAVPLTRRVRRVVDHRFDRSRFDAEQVASAFAARLRARPERGDVPSDLLDVVQRTVAPAHAGVWLVQG